MKYRILLWILWPSFLVSGLAEGFLFSFVQPDDLVFFGHHPNISDEGIYTLGFFAIWIFCALSSALTTYILPGIDTDSAGKDRGVL
ncbi:hypothetical protein [Polynucleobacter sphagniphilus]|uniref:Transmembrane protein n=1 Tax=Polynucleobacter sphagniphilus TaxID=1743169 RepID=A0AA43M8E2_9BURK|nr:hypothetical protein [Polynucleobacter sphagniphilus]MDH6503895.1 hypothetical protein [Polynucleobacter sphagniphilus]MDH6512387.1 hypothetical protein [Polynucleobacter sphagniphilus]